MKKIELAFVSGLTLYGVLGVFEKLKLLNLSIYNIKITLILIIYLYYKFYIELNKKENTLGREKIRIFYYIEIGTYIIFSIIWSLSRRLDGNGAVYNLLTKKVLLNSVIIYSILFFIISFIIYKKVKDKRIWFLNAILLYFRVFLLIGILKYVK